MKFLFIISISYLVAVPCQARLAQTNLTQYLSSTHGGDLRKVAKNLRYFIDVNRECPPMKANSVALTVRRLRSIYPANLYAEMIGISHEELRNIENGKSVPHDEVLQKLMESLSSEDILNYYRFYDAVGHSPLAMFLASGDAGKEEVFFRSLTSMAATEAFLAIFSKSLHAAAAGSAADAEAVAATEARLAQAYPNAPHTFTELAREAAPVIQKLSADSQQIAVYYDELALKLTSSSN